ncbi:MAG: dienelactone hydrolase family protein [Pseudonocardia sp.]
MGYVALVPDVYYRNAGWAPFEMESVFADAAERARLFGLMSTLSRDRIIADSGAYLDFLLSRDEVEGTAVGTTGYCMGGRMSMIAGVEHRLECYPVHHGFAVPDNPTYDLEAEARHSPRYANRVAWALTHVGKAGLVERPARGQYAITPRGKQVLAENADRVDMSVLDAFLEYQDFRRSTNAVAPPGSAPEASSVPAAAVDLSPGEAMETLVKASDSEVAGQLLDRILAQPPAFLERIALSAARGHGVRRPRVAHRAHRPAR